VKSTGDAYALEDTTLPPDNRDRVYEYLDRGGTSNVANCLRYLVDEYSSQDSAYDAPVHLPTEGVYHPDHPGASYEELRATFDVDSLRGVLNAVVEDTGQVAVVGGNR
jgi:cobaltochelatase CobN